MDATVLNRAELGRRLRAAREARGLSLRALADAAGVSHSHVGGIERGETTPTIETAARIGQVLGLPPTFWFAGPVQTVAAMEPVRLEPASSAVGALIEALEAAAAHLRMRYA